MDLRRLAASLRGGGGQQPPHVRERRETVWPLPFGLVNHISSGSRLPTPHDMASGIRNALNAAEARKKKESQIVRGVAHITRTSEEEKKEKEKESLRGVAHNIRNLHELRTANRTMQEHWARSYLATTPTTTTTTTTTTTRLPPTQPPTTPAIDRGDALTYNPPARPMSRTQPDRGPGDALTYYEPPVRRVSKPHGDPGDKLTVVTPGRPRWRTVPRPESPYPEARACPECLACINQAMTLSAQYNRDRNPNMTLDELEIACVLSYNVVGGCDPACAPCALKEKVKVQLGYLTLLALSQLEDEDSLSQPIDQFNADCAIEEVVHETDHVSTFMQCFDNWAKANREGACNALFQITLFWIAVVGVGLMVGCIGFLTAYEVGCGYCLKGFGYGRDARGDLADQVAAAALNNGGNNPGNGGGGGNPGNGGGGNPGNGGGGNPGNVDVGNGDILLNDDRVSTENNKIGGKRNGILSR